MNRWLVISILLTAAALAASLAVYYGAHDRLPAEVPTHWDYQGRPDRVVPRDRVLPYLLAAPAGMAVLVLLTPLLPWLSPRALGVDEFRDTYGYIMALVVAMIGYLHGVFLLAALRPDLDVLRLLVGGLFLFFALLGNVLGKVRRNFWMGVRTPWTLASETVWIRTHRLAAWVFVAAGLVGFVAALAGAPRLVYAGILSIVVLVPVVYSLVLYKVLARQGRV
jgi:uncharacterized membrane protein